MRFLRSRRPNKSSRANRVEKVPKGIEDKIQNAATAFGLYFDLWLAHGESWDKVQAYEKQHMEKG
eukprot:11292664-Alexandrium_andersonii.AAC.1